MDEHLLGLPQVGVTLSDLVQVGCNFRKPTDDRVTQMAHAGEEAIDTLCAVVLNTLALRRRECAEHILKQFADVGLVAVEETLRFSPKVLPTGKDTIGKAGEPVEALRHIGKRVSRGVATDVGLLVQTDHVLCKLRGASRGAVKRSIAHVLAKLRHDLPCKLITKGDTDLVQRVLDKGSDACQQAGVEISSVVGQNFFDSFQLWDTHPRHVRIGSGTNPEVVVV